MTSKIPKKVRKAVQDVWQIEDSYEKTLGIKIIAEDWVVWPLSDVGKLGGRRLIVPQKKEAVWFAIPSAYGANEQTGVSWNYEVSIISCANPCLQIAEIIAKYTDISPHMAFEFLHNTPAILGVFFMHTLLQFIRELAPFDIQVSLIRPDNKGGYTTTSL